MTYYKYDFCRVFMQEYDDKVIKIQESILKNLNQMKDSTQYKTLNKKNFNLIPMDETINFVFCLIMIIFITHINVYGFI